MKVSFVGFDRRHEQHKEKLLPLIEAGIASGNYILGDYVSNFEAQFAEYCGCKHAIGVGNATDAQFLLMKAYGVGPGDEVIVPANSFIATAGAVAAVGATIVFADVGDDFNICPVSVESKITSKTKAVIPVHLTGRPANLAALLELKGKYGFYLLEDCAQAVGAIYRKKRVGSIGDGGFFSLHPLKNLHVLGDGGVIVTNNDSVAASLKLLRNHGLKDRNICSVFGYNSRLDALQAIVATYQLSLIEDWTQRFREIAHTYREGLKDFVQVPEAEEPDMSSVYHNFVIRSPKRDKLSEHLNSCGVETKIHYPIPIHLQPAAEHLGYQKGDFPISERQAGEILSLPIYPELEPREVAFVIECIRSFEMKG